MADTKWPDVAYPETADAIDTLIAQLNAATSPDLVFERDALDVDRPEDWGAVEMTGTRDEYADGRIIDRSYMLDIWAAVGDRASEWLARIEAVLGAWGSRLSWQLAERAYLHGVKKVLWHWQADLWDLIPPEG